MIIVRDVFRLKFGKAREVKALMQESKKIMGEQMKKARVLFDLVGPAYTMVLEIGYNNLSEFESDMNSVMGKPEWRDWYMKLIPFIEQSYREIFTLME